MEKCGLDVELEISILLCLIKYFKKAIKAIAKDSREI